MNDSVAERVASVFSIPVHIGKETGADEESIYDADGGFVCECNSKSRARVISEALNAISTLTADNTAKDAEIARLNAERTDLATLVRRLCRACNSITLSEQAADYLKRKNLQGSILR